VGLYVREKNVKVLYRYFAKKSTIRAKIADKNTLSPPKTSLLFPAVGSQLGSKNHMDKGWGSMKPPPPPPN